jgi:hypothetical protein
VRAIRDLKGKKVAVSSIGSLEYYFLASLQRETPRLCRGGSNSLTDTGVHQGNSES